MRLWRHLPLSLRLPLLAAAMMVLVGVVASQQVLRALTRVQDARVRELAQMHVEGLSVALGPLVLRRDIWEIYDTLDRASKGSEGQRMVLTVVADETGHVLAATDPRKVPVDSLISDLARGAAAPGDLTVGSSSPILRLGAPLVYQGRTVGTIVSELDVSDLIAERRHALVILVVGNALATLVLAVAGYVVLRRMLRPLSAIATQMADTSGRPHPIPQAEIPEGDDELTRLAQTYNAMTAAIAAKAEAERRLAERERFVALGRLSSSLAHEINNPLGGLLNATDTIRSFPDRPEIVLQSAELLDRGLRHLRDVVRVTLDHNRVDHGGRNLLPEDFEDLRALIQPEIARLQQRLDWSASIPAAGVAVAAGPVRQIVLNLILNASAAAGQGGHVGMSASVDSKGLDIEITDTGPGMSPSALDRLLTDAPLAPGGGVGLRLARELAMRLGGRILHERREGVTRIRLHVELGGQAADAA
ncbi:signal transduction histidine kinase [Albidovulum inexpectatum]|uniref:histidine kinase n=1 Tax=Albidovulum inexpectatum TaxID=196587 RepID=A0A2S5JLQ6_9RHOB|nr:HAMP domain-containing sensor histidine kinase [Albidovulum inexpectatum]PPB82353.1 signal transduction histidine kinase [Albidovulum inexpectatum]